MKAGPPAAATAPPGPRGTVGSPAGPVGAPPPPTLLPPSRLGGPLGGRRAQGRVVLGQGAGEEAGVSRSTAGRRGGPCPSPAPALPHPRPGPRPSSQSSHLSEPQSLSESSRLRYPRGEVGRIQPVRPVHSSSCAPRPRRGEQGCCHRGRPWRAGRGVASSSGPRGHAAHRRRTEGPRAP